MAYDALGNYIPGDDETSLDEMRLALLKQTRPTPQQIERAVAPTPSAMQIPTGGTMPAPKPDRPLDKATRNLESLAFNMNPLVFMKSLQDVARTAVVNPMLMPASIAVEAAQGKPAREITGSTFYQPPTTPAGQAFEEALGKTMETAKVPHMWPMAPRPAGMRPALTPNDVRVMGAEATRVGRQVRDIPMDYANAQAGMARLDPVTGSPTLGSRLGQAERGVTQAGMQLEKRIEPIVTDIMARGGTSADVLAAMAGQPAYAIRPKGTSLATPVRGETATTVSYPFDPVQRTLQEALAEPQNPVLSPGELETAYTRSTPLGDPAIENAFHTYAQQRIMEMYPTASSLREAEGAYEMRYADPGAKQAHALELLEDFLTKTPEGQASGVPLPAEMQARHEAAVTWLNGTFANYIKRNVGTEGDPLVKLAGQGLTMNPAETVLEQGFDPAIIDTASRRRAETGFLPAGSFNEALTAKESQIDQVRNELAEIERKRSTLADLARSQGLGDPADLPEYAALTNPRDRKIRERDRLQQEYEQLRLGQAYENMADVAVVPKKARSVQEGLDFSMEQFYPSIMKTPADESVYLASNVRLRELGLGDIANKFYDDVMSGAIPLDKVQKMTVENFVRGKSQERVKLEAERKAKEAERLATATKRFQAVVSKVPNDKVFGNAAVIELTKDTPVDVATARVSEDTAVLDHCVGQGGGAGGNLINPFTGKEQRYQPIVDPFTGQRNPKASNDSTAYIRGLEDGNELASFRNVETGYPVATLELQRSHLGQQGQQMYRVGYASGYSNGKIDPAYSNAIRDYLNSRADNIAGVGDYLSENAGVYDMSTSDDVRAVGRKLNLTRDQMSAVNYDALPRFVTADDVRQVLAQPQQRQVTTQVPMLSATALSEAFDNVQGALNNAVDVARDNYPGPEAAAGEREVGSMLRSRVNAHLREFLPNDTPSENFALRLTNVIDAITNDVQAWANTRNESVTAIRTGLQELLVDLEGIRDHVLRQLDEQELAARGAPEVAPEALNLPNIVNTFVEGIPQASNDTVQRYISSIAREHNLQVATPELVNALRRVADVADNVDGTAAIALQGIADAVDAHLGPEPIENINLFDLEPDVGHPANAPAITPEPAEPANPIAPFRPIVQDVRGMSAQELNNTMTTDERLQVGNLANQIVNLNDANELNTIAGLIRNHAMSSWENFPQTMREALARQIEEFLERQQGGRAEGGPVRGYQKGGSVEAPGLLSASHRAIERSEEMFPRASSQDSAADAARHMLASGYLAKSWNPTVAKAAGWLHEFTDAPTRTLRHNLGLGNPRYDYPMDMHNNQLGIKLAKKAKTVEEFERMVQEAAMQATPKQEEGRAYVMPAAEAREAAKNSVRQYANGGTVSRTPDLDSMRLQLMMRGK